MLDDDRMAEAWRKEAVEASAALSGAEAAKSEAALQLDVYRATANAQDASKASETIALAQRIADPTDRARMLTLIGIARLEARDAATAEQLLRPVVEHRDPSVPESVRSTAKTSLARAALDLHHYSEAKALYAELAERKEATAHDWVGLATACLSLDDRSGAAAAIERLLSLPVRDHISDSNIELMLATSAWEHGLAREALRLAQRVTETSGGSSAAHADLANLFADALIVRAERDGHLDDARRMLTDRLDAQRKALGSEHLDLATTCVAIAAIAERSGDFGLAEDMLKRAIRIREAKLGSDHPDVADATYALARLYERQGRQAESEALRQMALAIWAKGASDGPLAPTTAPTSSQLTTSQLTKKLR